MNESNLLQLILDYEMTKEEGKAWKTAIIYLQLMQKYFPERKTTIGKGDPRKSSLFKHCYKFIRENQDLPESDYRLYVTAQLQILKNIDQTLIDPNCLVGQKAWNRWLVWKKKYKAIAMVQKADVNPNHNKKVIADLTKTKEFLLTKDVKESLNSRVMFRWVALGYVTPYFLVLSPIVQEWIESTKTNLLEMFTIDVTLYKKGITDEIREFFNNEFNKQKL